MRVGLKIVSALLGFVAGFFLCLLVSELTRYVVSGSNYSPGRPVSPLVVFGAVFIAIAAWRHAPSPEGIASWFSPAIRSQYAKLAVATFVPWALMVLMLVFSLGWFPNVFSPYARNFWPETGRLLAFLFAPPLAVLVGVYLVKWANRPEERAPSVTTLDRDQFEFRRH